MKIIHNILNETLLKSCILIVLICSFNISNAITVTSVQSGNWDDPATWDCACVPSAKDDVVISSGDTVTLTSDITVNNLTVGPTAVLDVSISNYEIAVGGNWINNGTFMHRSGEVIFGKKGTSIIGGSNSTTFYDLTLNKKSHAGVTLAAPVTVIHNLTLEKGIVYTDISNYITMLLAASMLGASDKSFIEGPIKIESDTIGRIVIGTGKNGKHKQIAIDVNSTDSSAFMVEYFDNAYPDTNYGPGINHLISDEYWQLFIVGGSANVSVILYWDENSGPIHSLSDVRVARFDSTWWEDEGNAAATGNLGAGSVLSDSLPSCRLYFALGCSDACNYKNNNGNGKKKNSGNEGTSSSDDEVVYGSKNENSDITDEENAYSINVRPNPAKRDKLCIDITGNKSREVLIVVVDMLGREFYSKVCILEDSKYTLAVDPNNKLTPGVYMIIATSRNSLYRKKVVIQ